MKIIDLRLYEEKLAKKKPRSIGPKVNYKLFVVTQHLVSLFQVKKLEN